MSMPRINGGSLRAVRDLCFSVRPAIPNPLRGQRSSSHFSPRFYVLDRESEKKNICENKTPFYRCCNTFRCRRELIWPRCLLWRSRRSECTDIWSGFLARPRLFSEIFFTVTIGHCEGSRSKCWWNPDSQFGNFFFSLSFRGDPTNFRRKKRDQFFQLFLKGGSWGIFQLHIGGAVLPIIVSD